MNKDKRMPKGCYFGLAFLLPLLGCILTTAFIYRGFPNLPGTLEMIDVHNMTQVIVPGSADVTFPKEGAYAVYYEYRSNVDGVQYSTSRTPPNLVCSLISATTGKEIGVSPEFIEGNTYSTKDDRRVGVHIMSISMTEPGTYTFFCHYPDKETEPKVVLAIGSNIFWELLNVGAKPIASILGGLVVLFFLGAIIIAIYIFAFLSQRRSMRLQDDAESGISTTTESL